MKHAGTKALCLLMAGGALFAGCVTDTQTGKAPNLDPGGCSVDFFQAWQHVPTQGGNLLKDGGFEEAKSAAWNGGPSADLPGASEKRRAEFSARVAPLIVQATCGDDPHAGDRCLRLSAPPAACGKQDGIVPAVSASSWQEFAPPPREKGQTYVLSYQCRGALSPEPPAGQARIVVSFYGAPEKTGRTKAVKPPLEQWLYPQSKWGPGVMPFVVPGNASSVRVAFELSGHGELFLDDVAVSPTLREDGLTPCLAPTTYLDNMLCLTPGDPMVIGFQFQNETDGKTYKPDLLLQVPADVKILDTASQRVPPGVKLVDDSNHDRVVAAKPVEPGGYVEYRVRVKWTKTWPGRNFKRWVPLLVSTSLPAGGRIYRCSYWIEDGGYRSRTQTFDLKVIPAAAPVTPPKTFKTGVVLSNMLDGLPLYSFCFDSPKPESVTAFAAFYKRLGFNAIHLEPSPLSQEMGRLGLERYTQPWGLMNGYTLGLAKKPDEALFRMADGKPIEGDVVAICPVEVYRKGPYFKSAIENDILRKILVTDRSAEQIMSNWEPIGYDAKGCFCDRCKEEFGAFSKLPPEELAKVWPREVLAKHKEEWIKFRRWQHGKMMVALEETVNALGREAGLDSHFIPEIHYGQLLFDWENLDRGLHRGYAAAEYMGKLPVLEPWGPYPCLSYTPEAYQELNGGLLTARYDYICGVQARCAARAEETRAFLASNLPPERRPRLIAFPVCSFYGSASQPEAVALETLTYFLCGYDGAFAYPMSVGTDARHWNALAETNRQIALFEPYVRQGEAVTKHTLAPETPMPRQLPRSNPRWRSVDPVSIDPRWQDLPLLLSWEYEREGKRLVAVGNFWERGEAFFRLVPKDLKDGVEYTLWEPTAARCYADSAGRTALSAAELAKGVLLHAGAFRFSFYVLEPHRKGFDYGTPVRPQDMEAAMRERLGGIMEACRQDATMARSPGDASAGDAGTPDCSALKPVRKDGLECAPTAWPGIASPCLRFHSGAQTLVIDPAGGGRVVSWKVGGVEQVHSEGVHGLLLDSFLTPNLVVSKPYTVVSVTAGDKGITATLRRRLGGEGGALAGLTFSKIVEVPAAGAGFRAVTRIANTTGMDVEFAYRSHNMPASLEGQKGWARLGSAVFKRDGKPRIFRRATAAPDPLLDVLPVDAKDLIAGNLVEFGPGPARGGVKVEGDLHSVMFWDDPAMACATCELVFPQTTLKPGATWDARTEWRPSPATP